MSQSGSLNSGGGGGIIQTILGDTGSITGATVTIYADNAANNSGATVEFVNAGTVSTLDVTDTNQNTLIGHLAGNLGIVSSFNTALGSSALAVESTGQQNTALGARALVSHVGGDNNVAVGFESMETANGSFYNCAMGTLSLYQLVNGQYNNVFGYISGGNYTGTESNNVCISAQGVVGDQNTLRIGDNTAGGFGGLNSAYIQGIYSNNQPLSGTVEVVTIDNTTGQLGVTASAAGSVTFTADTGTPFSTSSVTIYANNAANNCGSSVEFNASTPDITLNVTDANASTYIGQGAGNLAATAIQNVAVGQGAMGSISTGRTNVAIGGTSTMAALGTGTFNIAIGGAALQQSAADNNNVAIGTNAMTGLNGGSSNVAIGDAAMGGNNGAWSQLVAVGANALASITGEQRATAIGWGALSSTQSNGDNTALGFQALLSLNGGDQNTAVGSNALASSVSDNNNAAFGWNSLLACAGGSQNTAIGTQTQQGQINGTGNTALGFESLFTATSGDYNTALGTGALYSVATGSYNAGVGYFAGINYNAAESNNIMINNPGVVAESNVLRVGAGTGTGQQQLSTAYISGINGNTVANTQLVTINSATDQLGTTSLGPVVFNWSDQAVSFNAAVGNGYFITAALTATLPGSPSEGDTISFIADTAGSFVIQANTGQSIRFGAAISSVAGTATDSSIGDSVTLVFRSATSTWISLTGPQGTWSLA